VSPIGTLPDKVLVGLLSVLIRFKSVDSIIASKETDTLSYLSGRGLTESMIGRFFTPFFQGIFLSALSSQSSRMFEFVFKMFTEGAATLPAQGMGELMLQLKTRLPVDTVILNARVTSITDGLITAMTGDKTAIAYRGKYTVVATEAPSASTLLSGTALIDVPLARKSVCLYFALDGPPPLTEPVLVLNGENRLAPAAFDTPGYVDASVVRINNVCFPSQISASYAPTGRSLASITLVGDLDSLTDLQLETITRGELMQWWGDAISAWSLLKIYRVPYAQPAQMLPYAIEGRAVRLAAGLYCCGDHRGSATLNGALDSGLRAADTVLEDIRAASVDLAVE
jgi:hypothetical protein